jgi:hypothetical protein
MKDKIVSVFLLTMTLLFIGSCIYFGIFEHVNWVKNIFIFYTWFTFCARFILMVTPNDNPEKIKYYSTYKDGKHFPKWFDSILYPAMVLVIASQEFWFTAIGWTFIMFFDLATRNHSETYFKEQEWARHGGLCL